MNASAVHPLHLTEQRVPGIRCCDQPACEVGGQKPLRRDLIERGGSSEAWYGGRTRRSLGQRTDHPLQNGATGGTRRTVMNNAG